jgi:hypothetical protein
MLRHFAVFICVLLIATIALQAKKKTITGFVFNKNTGKSLPGATIRVPGTNTGTYSSSYGFFRLKVPDKTMQIKVSSIGFKSQFVKLKSNKDTLFVYLVESSVKKKGVTVTGAIEANEVIKRAIARKDENVEKLKTFQGRLYSKMVLALDGSLFLQGEKKNTLSIGNDKEDKAQELEKYRDYIMETFSDVFIDYEKNVNQTVIIQRHQTSNLKPANNLMALSKFINFYSDEVQIMDVHIKTPLSEDALSYYKFKIIDRQLYDDNYVYEISVIPATTVYPAFYGTIKILEGSYNLIEIDLRPSENTAITFVDSLRFVQKYRQSVENVWYPSFLEMSGKARFEFIKGMMDVLADLTITGIYSDVIINKPLPDSIYHREEKHNVTVEKDADSTKAEFWENNSLREITTKEKDIYVKIDTLVAKDSLREKERESQFKWSLLPYIDFNRVSSISTGLQTTLEYYNFSLDVAAAYSFGLKDIIWEDVLSYTFKFDNHNSLAVGITAFQKPSRLSLDRSYSRLISSAFAGLFHFDYYDYFKNEGFSLFADYQSSLFDLKGGAAISNQYSLPKTTNNSIFSKKQWRENPKINDGNFTTGFLSGKIGDIYYRTVTPHYENELEFSSVFGKGDYTNNMFFSVYGKYKTSIPLFYTGYTPVKLFLLLEGGLNSSNVPIQYMNKMQSSMLFITQFGNFLTAPPAEYGGREYYAGHFALNLGDLWWRALHLPLYEGRGMNLILSGAYSRFFAKGYSIYRDTGNDHYSEIGFGFTHIPTFVSNVFYLSFDARWGIGPIASGRFGWALSFSLPF